MAGLTDRSNVMRLQAPQVVVDAENLWFILQGYKGMLDNECTGMNVDKWRKVGFYFQEYEIIARMEEQIMGIL
jgi:hypothetical protein